MNGSWNGLMPMIMREDAVGMVGAVGLFAARQKVKENKRASGRRQCYMPFVEK